MKISRGDDYFSMILQIIGAALAVPILVLCIIRGAIEYGLVGIMSGVAFGVSAIVLFVLSAIFHGVSAKHKKSRATLKKIDHCLIFALIAGTYTPITLIAMMKTEPAIAWSFFGVVWFFAIAGSILSIVGSKALTGVLMACYLALGWLVILCLPSLMMITPPIGIVLLFLGGILYSISALFYYLERDIRHMHTIYHMCVLGGSICHGIMILLCIL